MGETGACEQRLHIQEHLDSEDVAEMFILLHFFFYMRLALILCSWICSAVRIAAVFGFGESELTVSMLGFSQIIGQQQYTMANVLQGIKEIGSHAVDIYDYLLAGFGKGFT